MRLSLTNILGVIFSLGILVFGITEITNVTTVLSSIPALSQYTFLNLPSLFIVLGGILNAVFITYQPKYVGQAFIGLFYLFSQAKTSSKTLENDLGEMLVWNDQIKNDRVNALSKLEDEHIGEVSSYN